MMGWSFDDDSGLNKETSDLIFDFASMIDMFWFNVDMYNKMIAVNVSFKRDGYMYFNDDKIIKVGKINGVQNDILFTGHGSGFDYRRTRASKQNEEKVLKLIHEKMYEMCLKILQGRYGMFMMDDVVDDDVDDEEFNDNDEIEVVGGVEDGEEDRELDEM